MAITFTNDRYFQTDVGNKIFQRVQVASQWFKILVTSKSVVPSQTRFLSKIFFDFWHSFQGTGDSTTIPLRFVVTNSSHAFAQTDLSLTMGVVYGVAVTWDGITGSQKIWVSGVPTQFGTFTGNTEDNSSAFQIGVSGSTAQIVYALDDHNIWDNYLLTATDIANLLTGTDPTTIGTSASWRGRWTMAGTTGANAAIGDAGLKNAYGGGGSLGTGGDGSDCITSGGAGSAIYAPSLVWAPTVGPSPAYIDTSGKVAVVFFESLINHTQTTPSQLLVTPTISKNGVSHGTLGTPWFTGYHPFAWYPLPPGIQAAKDETGWTLDAPTAWANTPAGSVEAMNALSLDNRTGKSVVRPDDYTPTLDIGVNNPQNPVALWGFYWPFKNWKYRTRTGRGKVTSNGAYPIYSNSGGANGIDSTGYPGPAGLWLVMWDAGNPVTPTQFTITTPTPATTHVTERTDLQVFPPSGVGMCRVFDVEHVSLTGIADLSISLNVNDPGTINYTNLWVVGPGDFDIVNGVVVLDRTDPLVLSRVYQSRVPQNVGSLRWEDSTIGGDPDSFPYPESLKKLTDESWGELSFIQTVIGYSAVGPVDTTATPYIYSPFLGRSGANGHTFAATLTTAITTTPARGTLETYTFSDAVTAPLMAGLEIQIDSEIMRIVSVSGTSVTVYRGSNGTTPAAHSAGTVTVFGRVAITTPGGVFWQMTTTVPHGITSGTSAGIGGSYPPLGVTDGTTVNIGGFTRPVYVNSPTTFIMAIGAQPGHPGGGLTGITTLDPSTHNWDRRWPGGASLPHEACAVATGKYPNANLHLNIWPDACDDLVYEIARRTLDNFPSGRKIYVENNNEPWNFRFGGFYYHSGFMGPLILPSNPFPLAHYAYRAFQMHDIFRTVFSAVGRGNEIMGIVNCFYFGTDAQNYLNYAIAQVKGIEAVAVAPYVDTEATIYNGNFFVGLDDEQGISMFVHDLWYNPHTYNPGAATTKGYIQAYNTATGNNCILIGYEGGIEWVTPFVDGIIANRDERNHDCVTNPDFYIAEQDFYAWLQMQGFDHLHVYALAMPWAPAAWGMYHGILQDHGRGDGTDSKLNNLLCRANPSSPNYKGSNVNQDLNTVSVRGQAFIDWLAAVAGSPPPPPPGSYSFLGPPLGTVDVATSPFIITPAEVITGTITATPSGGGLTGADAVTKTFSASQDPQAFTLTPTATGAIVITLSNTAGLSNPSPFTCTILAQPPSPFRYVLRRRRDWTRLRK